MDTWKVHKIKPYELELGRNDESPVIDFCPKLHCHNAFAAHLASVPSFIFASHCPSAVFGHLGLPNVDVSHLNTENLKFLSPFFLVQYIIQLEQSMSLKSGSSSLGR